MHDGEIGILERKKNRKGLSEPGYLSTFLHTSDVNFLSHCDIWRTGDVDFLPVLVFVTVNGDILSKCRADRILNKNFLQREEISA